MGTNGVVTRKSRRWSALVLGFPIGLLAANAADGATVLDSFEGQLSSAVTGQMVTSGVWTSVTFNWKVNVWDTSPVAEGFVYEYRYELAIGGTQGAISHLLLETTNPLEMSAIKNLSISSNASTIGPSLFETGGSNPGLPSDLYGLKIEPTGDNVFTLKWSFFSVREPVWGDFYAKDGRAGGNGWNYVYNAALGDDPLSAPAVNGEDILSSTDPRYAKILRPDGFKGGETIVPLPSSVWMGMGLLSAMGAVTAVRKARAKRA